MKKLSIKAPAFSKKTFNKHLEYWTYERVEANHQEFIEGFKKGWYDKRNQVFVLLLLIYYGFEIPQSTQDPAS